MPTYLPTCIHDGQHLDQQELKSLLPLQALDIHNLNQSIPEHAPNPLIHVAASTNFFFDQLIKPLRLGSIIS